MWMLCCLKHPLKNSHWRLRNLNPQRNALTWVMHPGRIIFINWHSTTPSLSSALNNLSDVVPRTHPVRSSIQSAADFLLLRAWFKRLSWEVLESEALLTALLAFLGLTKVSVGEWGACGRLRLFVTDGGVFSFCKSDRDQLKSYMPTIWVWRKLNATFFRAMKGEMSRNFNASYHGQPWSTRIGCHSQDLLLITLLTSGSCTRVRSHCMYLSGSTICVCNKQVQISFSGHKNQQFQLWYLCHLPAIFTNQVGEFLDWF